MAMVRQIVFVSGPMKGQTLHKKDGVELGPLHELTLGLDGQMYVPVKEEDGVLTLRHEPVDVFRKQ